MTLVTISIIVAAVIYTVYNILALSLFGIPKSLSMTYYLYKEKFNKGFVFPVMMFTVVAFMMPAWLTMSEGSDFQFLAFLAPASIAFVGAAPAFKSSSLENSVHQISAYFAAACSILWIILVTPYWYYILVWFGYVGLASIFTSSYKSSLIYWLETIAFGATFTSAIMYSI